MNPFLFSSGVTKYIVCVAEHKLANSQKIRQAMHFRKKPTVVNLEWFIDSLEACQIMPTEGEEGSRYLVDTSPLEAAVRGNTMRC